MFAGLAEAVKALVKARRMDRADFLAAAELFGDALLRRCQGAAQALEGEKSGVGLAG